MGEKIVIAEQIISNRVIAQDVKSFEYFTQNDLQQLDLVTNEPFSPVIINDIENATNNRIEILAPQN